MGFFIKTNHLNNDSLIKESKGLTLLNNTLTSSNNSYLKIPNIYSVSNNKLEIEKIESIQASSKHMKNFGVGLAKLHKVRFEEFGLDYNNFIGLNPQKNILSKNWGEFFFEYRLLFQINLIKNKNLKDEFDSILQQNRVKLIDFLNDTTEHASLVHGDLWSGNVLFEKEDVYLIDPAVYYADREVDVAMTKMFGGFSNEFYHSYNSTYELSKEFNKKEIVYNFYHYLNHYNLFSDTYLDSCYSSMDFINRNI